MVDNLSPEHRKKAMRAVKGSDTSLERACDAEFAARGWVYERNVADLPGKPDFVFRAAQLIVFVDGDFWHGWRFPLWRDTLGDYWQAKIERNRRRDQRNFRKLRRLGWKVVRFWGHQVTKELPSVVERVALLLRERRASRRKKTVAAESASTQASRPAKKPRSRKRS